MNKLKDYLDKVTTIVNPVEEHMIKDFNLLNQKYFELKIKEQLLNKRWLKNFSISVQQSVISGLLEKYKENQFYSNLNEKIEIIYKIYFHQNIQNRK